MHDNDAVDTGLNVFILKEEDKRSVLAQQAYFAQIYAGESTPTRQDLDALLQSKPKAPLLPVQLRQQVKHLQVTDAILFGTNSVKVVALETYLKNLLSCKTDIYRLMSKIPILTVLLAKKLTIQHNTCLCNQAVSPTAIAAPNYSKVFDDIDMDEHWEPTLTPGFLEKVGLSAVNQLPRYGLVFGATTGGTSNLPGVADESTVNDAGDNNAGGAPTGSNNEVNNPYFVDDLFGVYKRSRVSCRQIRQKISSNQLPALPPSKVDQAPMSLAFHAKGHCNKRCSRSSDHVSYTREELQPLVTWCCTHWPNTNSTT